MVGRRCWLKVASKTEPSQGETAGHRCSKAAEEGVRHHSREAPKESEAWPLLAGTEDQATSAGDSAEIRSAPCWLAVVVERWSQGVGEEQARAGKRQPTHSPATVFSSDCRRRRGPIRPCQSWSRNSPELSDGRARLQHSANHPGSSPSLMVGPLHNTKGSAKAERLGSGRLQPPMLKGEGHSAAR